MKKSLIMTALFSLACAVLSAQPKGAAAVMENDPNGTTMTLVCVSVVFSALVVLFVLFWLLGKYMSNLAHRKDAKSKGEVTPILKAPKGEMYSGDVVAAIGLAIAMYQDELHDRESSVITINKVAKVYSPWSSKIYGMTQMPEKNKR